MSLAEQRLAFYRKMEQETLVDLKMIRSQIKRWEEEIRTERERSGLPWWSV